MVVVKNKFPTQDSRRADIGHRAVEGMIGTYRGLSKQQQSPITLGSIKAYVEIVVPTKGVVVIDVSGRHDNLLQ